MNEGAHKYWKTLYSYDYFVGTSPLYGIWIDMNEPSVGGQEDGTMPKTAVHILGDSWKVLHRDCHNVYGHMMALSTDQVSILRVIEIRS
jgi:mannosyl-oligosaccharide alpha-1,3-glucosidase